VVRRKISYSLTDLEDSEWEYHENPGKRGNFVKKKRALLSRTELGLNSQQWAIVRAKTELFEVSSTADVAAEAFRQLNQAENARNKCTKVKGDLNQIMKCGIAIAKLAIVRMAKRASGLGEPDGAAKERVLDLIKEREALRKENKLLKKQLNIREEEDGNARGLERTDAWTLAHSVANHTRSRTSAERRQIVSTSESEEGVMGRVPFLARDLGFSLGRLHPGALRVGGGGYPRLGVGPRRGAGFLSSAPAAAGAEREGIVGSQGQRIGSE